MCGLCGISEFFWKLKITDEEFYKQNLRGVRTLSFFVHIFLVPITFISPFMSQSLYDVILLVQQDNYTLSYKTILFISYYLLLLFFSLFMIIYVYYSFKLKRHFNTKFGVELIMAFFMSLISFGCVALVAYYIQLQLVITLFFYYIYCTVANWNENYVIYNKTLEQSKVYLPLNENA